MSLYLVVHTPIAEHESAAHPPTRLADFVAAHGQENSHPRWLRTWSPDLHDERIFTLWDAVNAEAIQIAIRAFGFLTEMTSHAISVKEWGPQDVENSGI